MLERILAVFAKISTNTISLKPTVIMYLVNATSTPATTEVSESVGLIYCYIIVESNHGENCYSKFLYTCHGFERLKLAKQLNLT